MKLPGRNRIERLKMDMVARIRRKAGQMACDNPLYNWSLGGSVPDHLAVTPVDTWPGDPERGRWLCGGAFSFADGGTLELHGDYWEPTGAQDAWLVHMHGFEWLRDLRALGGDAARRQARDMLQNWMHHYASWDHFSWRADVTGLRVSNWIALYDFFGASADDELQEEFFEALMRQARHLSRALPGTVHGVPLLHGIRGLIYAGIALSGRENWLEQGLDLLEDETKKQILGDGGHVSRSPMQLIDALRVYIDIRAALRVAGYPVPEQVEHTIDRMAQAVRFFRYADKGFALFNGTQEGDCGLIDCILLKSNGRGRIVRSLPQSGYERVTIGRSVLMVDGGAPASYPHDRFAHAAPLSFEFVYGKERIFVACGSHPTDPDWQDALRATAAHNALSIDYRNACEIRGDHHFGRRARMVTMTRDETNDACLVEGTHDGYVPVNGITHRRRLYLGDQGHDLRGEENLTCSIGLSKPVEVAVRFHLHPRVQVSLIRDGEEALLRLPHGAGWRFVHSGGLIALENSIYLGEGHRPRKTKQLVIHGIMETDHAKLKWALQREGV